MVEVEEKKKFEVITYAEVVLGGGRKKKDPFKKVWEKTPMPKGFNDETHFVFVELLVADAELADALAMKRKIGILADEDESGFTILSRRDAVEGNSGRIYSRNVWKISRIELADKSEVLEVV